MKSIFMPNRKNPITWKQELKNTPALGKTRVYAISNTSKAYLHTLINMAE